MPTAEISTPPDAILSGSSNSPSVSLPDSPILSSDGLLNSLESVPDPPRHRIPALLSDSLLTASRHSSSPVAAKPIPPPPSQLLGIRYGSHRQFENEIGGRITKTNQEREEKTFK